MKKTLKDRKGYMLVEIVLAFAITFIFIYFAFDVIIKVKEKNDDLIVSTLVTTDQTIITNYLMAEIKKKPNEFDCDKLQKAGQTIKYNNYIFDVVNDYTTIGDITCRSKLNELNNIAELENKSIEITIPLSIQQMPDKKFDVYINYKLSEKYDYTPPTGTLDASISGPIVTATLSLTDDKSGVKDAYDWKISTSSTCDASITGFESTNTTEHTFKGLTAWGNYYVCTRFQDKSGNVGFLGKPITFSLDVKDYVSYQSSITSKQTVGTCSFNPSDLKVWQVIRINGDDTVEIVSDNVASSCRFSGQSGYNSYTTTLNSVATKFENSSYSVGNRYPANDGNGTTLIKNSLGTYFDADKYGYFVNSKRLNGTEYQHAIVVSESVSYWWLYNTSGGTHWSEASIRPIIVLKSGLKYGSGLGTQSSPYVLKN